MALNFGKLNFSTSFNPTSAFPLDARYYFESYSSAVAAAATAEEAGSSNTVYFFGEQLVVVEDNKATLYLIQKKSEGDGGELVEVGSKTLGDDKTITLENGTLSLKDFGKSYYRYVAKTEIEEAHYEKVTGFKAGLQPQISSENGQLVLAWYEPNPTTVEGLEAEISALSSSVKDLTDVVNGTGAGEEHQPGLVEKVFSIETVLGDEDDGLIGQVNDLDTQVSGIEDQLDLKQDTLVAGDFISIAEDKKTISVDFTGLILDGGSAEDWAEASDAEETI